MSVSVIGLSCGIMIYGFEIGLGKSFEIAGSCVTLGGTIWLSVDALRARKRVRSQGGAKTLSEIMKNAGTQGSLKDEHGNSLDSDQALSLWFAKRTVTWNWIALVVMAVGFVLDIIGKIIS